MKQKTQLLENHSKLYEAKRTEAARIKKEKTVFAKKKHKLERVQ